MREKNIFNLEVGKPVQFHSLLLPFSEFQSPLAEHLGLQALETHTQ